MTIERGPQPPTPAPRPRRPRTDATRIHGLDGIRAVAVIAVLVFHLRPQTLPGGFLGVDVFFVVSGFLITTLLVREIRSRGRLNLVGFWVRRARRLIPALVAVVVISTAIALPVGDDLLVDVRRQALGALTFSNNWLEIGAGSSYFTHTAPQLFVNFWSLAVEEQFYLIWPIALALLLALTRTTQQRVIGAVALAVTSAVLMGVLAADGVTRVYYGTDTHAFGLMIGAALALAWAGAPTFGLAHWHRLRVSVALAGLAGLVALMVMLDGESLFAYRGGIVLASVCTAAALAALATARSTADPLVRLASLRPLVWVGERSYGIYLWHWPVLLIITALLPPTVSDSGISWLGRALTVLATFTLAALSYTYLESPIRADGFRATLHRWRAAIRRPAVGVGVRLGLAGAMAVVFAVALVVAPDKSQVEQQLEAAEEAMSSAAAEASVAAEAATDAATDAAEVTAAAEAPTPDGAEATAAATSGPRVSAPVGTGVMPTGEQISAFGDSMLYVASPALTAQYPGIAIDAESNRQWPAVVDAIAAAVEAGTVRDVVIIVAGSNAGLRDPAPLEQAIDLLGPGRLVVLVNLYHGSSWIAESNENMAAVAAEHPNVVIADWNSAITANLDQLQPDGVHPDMDGMYLFTDVITQALATATGT